MTKIVFSFDDGRADSYRLFLEMLKENYVPATLNVTTNYVLKASDKGAVPCINKPLTLSMLQEIDSQSLFEIAGHGRQHMNEIQNLFDGVNDLRDVCNSKITGIASPCCLLKESTVLINKELFLNNGISYIRLGDRITSFCFIKKVVRKLNRLFFHIPYIYAFVHEQTFIDEKDTFILYSVPVLYMDTVSEVIALIKRAVKKDKSLILMFHSVLYKNEPEYHSHWSWDWRKFEMLIKKVKEMESLGVLRISITQELILGK